MQQVPELMPVAGADLVGPFPAGLQVYTTFAAGVAAVGAAYSITTLYGQSLAQGVQLDVLAQFVGAERFLPGYSPSVIYFGQQDTTGSYSSSIGGYGDVTSTPPAETRATR